MLPAFLGKNSVVGKLPPDNFYNGRFGGPVGFGHKVHLTLVFHFYSGGVIPAYNPPRRIGRPDGGPANDISSRLPRHDAEYTIAGPAKNE